MILKASAKKRLIRSRNCAHCGLRISVDALKITGKLTEGEGKPVGVYYHIDCFPEAFDVAQYPKVKKAIEDYKGG
jgi:hypothetical protein